jgi:hypothetical protein
MRIRTALLAASIVALPVLAMAQTAPATPPAVASPTATPEKTHHDRAERQQFRAERHAKYEKLDAADKAKYDDLTKQIKQLHHERMQILGMSKS